MTDMIEIEAPDGTIVEFAAGTPDEVIKQVMSREFSGPAVPLGSRVDKDRGAPAFVRAVVGGSPEDDRLANMRKYYPDAVPYEGDNFVFTDPETLEPTMYNPVGFDAGDVASVGREMSQAAGGTLGGLVGAGQTVATAGASAPVVPLYVGAGTAAGGTLWDASQKLFNDTIDTRSVPQKFVDTGIDFAGGALGQRAGELMEQGAKAGVSFVRNRAAPAARELARDFRSLGVTNPPAGAVSGSKAVQSAEQALSNMPGSADVMQRSYAQTLDEVADAANTLASSLTPKAATRQSTGEVLVSGAKSAASRFEARSGSLYDDAYDLIPDDAVVSPSALKQMKARVEARISQAPESMGPVLGPVLKRIDSLIADAGDSGVPFRGFRDVRTVLGKDLKSPQTIGGSGAQVDELRALYGAVTEDMNAAIRSYGGDAARRIALADRYFRYNMNISKPLMDKLVKLGDEPEKAVAYALQGAKDGGSRLTRLRRMFTPEEWDEVVGLQLREMGRARAGAQDASGEAFSVSTFLTNINKLSPEAQKAMFGGNRYATLRPSLAKLTRVASALKEGEKMANPSGTARSVNFALAVSALGGGAALDTFTGTDLALPAVAGAIVAPRVAAKLITSPAFVRWLSSVPTMTTQANGWMAHLGRLVGIAKVNPAIKGEVQQYLDALRAVKPSAQTSQQQPQQEHTATTPQHNQ